MASILSQPQDLFFEFDFAKEVEEQDNEVDVLKSKEDIFLIGCFKNDQRQHIEQIAGDVVSGANIRLGKGNDGWINKDDSRIANPQFVILYELGNEDIQYCFRVLGSRVCNEEQMRENGYDLPNGDYLVYKIVGECKITGGCDIKKLVAEYREKTNWEDGKPIYMTGREILQAGKAKAKKDTRKVQKESDLNGKNLTL